MTFGQSEKTANYEGNKFYAFPFLTGIVNGCTIVSAEARNNLEYKGEARTGVWIKTSNNIEFGLLKWDLNTLSYLDYSKDSKSPEIKPIEGIIADVVKKYYMQGEEIFFTEIAKAIQGKTIKPIVYIAKSVGGNIYPNAIFAVE